MGPHSDFEYERNSVSSYRQINIPLAVCRRINIGRSTRLFRQKEDHAEAPMIRV
jgi:hypothetical protein